MANIHQQYETKTTIQNNSATNKKNQPKVREKKMNIKQIKTIVGESIIYTCSSNH